MFKVTYLHKCKLCHRKLALKKPIQITRRMVDYRIIQNCNKQQKTENKDQENEILKKTHKCTQIGK